MKHPEHNEAFRRWLYEAPLVTQAVLKHMAELMQGQTHDEVMVRRFHDALGQLLTMSEAIMAATAAIEKEASGGRVES